MNSSQFIELPSGLEFPKIIPGPMEGVMNELFCAVAHRLQLCQGWMTPYIRVTTHVPRSSRLAAFMRPFSAGDLPVIVQLMGTNGDVIQETAQRLLSLGAVGINLNFACPSNQVVRSGTGGAMLKAPDDVICLTKKIKKAIGNASLSIKIRSGFDDWHECGSVLSELCRIELLDFVAVHFRTVKEMYGKVENVEERLRFIIEQCGDNIPVIGSGDIFSTEDALGMLEYGFKGTMAARGLLRDPFLIKRIENSLAGDRVLFEVEQGRRMFFNTLLDICHENNTQIKKSKLLEYAGMMWGRPSKLFRQLCVLDVTELNSFRLPVNF
ncbi:MAG: tRNA-dihydrouridine synthase family protein [Lentisphaerae bacterium]|nr:tRNA-dihydrouridine synthase family protein [Lentisphaerota bacterium]MCP4101909.1 tRNA-dihydrouridine synthase family protein [Lentisphaerota bacterium]